MWSSEIFLMAIGVKRYLLKFFVYEFYLKYWTTTLLGASKISKGSFLEIFWDLISKVIF